MNTQFQITVDQTSLHSKPPQSQRGLISNRLINTITVTIREFAEIVGPKKSWTWTMGIFRNKKVLTENWISQQVFALDFDNDNEKYPPTLEPKDIKERFYKNGGIIPNLIYPSFSDTPEKRKFRVILVLEKPITDTKTVRYIWSALKKEFPEADPKPTSFATYFFPGPAVEIISEELVQNKNFLFYIDNLTKYYDKGSLRKVTKRIGKRKDLKSLDDSGAELKESYVDRLNKLKKSNCFDPDKLADTFKVFRQFVEGEWLRYPQLFGLATALHWVKGGKLFMKDTMLKYNNLGKTDYQGQQLSIIDTVAYYNYLPENFSKYSIEDVESGFKHPLEIYFFKKGEIEVIEKADQISLAAGMEKFNSVIDKLINHADHPDVHGKINLIKVPTAFGKTECLSRFKNSIVTFPTNYLLNEVHENRFGGRPLKSVGMPKIGIPFYDKQVKRLYDLGFHKEARNIFKKVLEDSRVALNDETKKEIKIFLDQYKLLKNDTSDGLIFTTHKIASKIKFKKDMTIFDEDPLSEILLIKKFDSNDLEVLCHTLIESYEDQKEEIIMFKEYLTKIEPGKVYNTPKFIKLKKLLKESWEELIDRQCHGDFNEFFNSKFFMRDSYSSCNYYFVRLIDLFPDRTYLIMSATLPISIYKQIFGDRIGICLDLMNIEQKGKIYQNCECSYSRISMKDQYKKINETIGSLRLITFKEQKGNFRNPVKEIHLGNTLGYDFLKGENLGVGGTFHYNESKYLLTAAMLGIDVNSLSTELSNRIITRGRYKFSFLTYEDPRLQEIQLSFIEAQQIQAAGRARTLREDVSVFVFSNLPITDNFLKLDEMKTIIDQACKKSEYMNVLPMN